MLTLKTLPQATEQEVFDQVAHHLLTQGEQSSTENGACLYRLGDLKCAAGCLIDDDEYNPDMDDQDATGGSNWKALANRELVPDTHVKLITALQDLHDSNDPADWEDDLKDFAEHNKLEWNF